MGESSLVGRLAEFATEVREGELPAAVRTSVRRRVLDTLGLCAAAVELDTSTAVLDLVEEQGGIAQATVVGRRTRVPAGQAALANGVLAHSLDYDDTHLPSIVHPSATIVPAALATAEAVGASGRDLTRAVAVGLELCVRLGLAGYDPDTRNSLFFDRGQHATSICGALGAAAASALLRGADTDGVANAVGVAASMASGLIEANRTGGTVKRLHCGWAAHAAVSAAELTGRGITGPPTVLEGRFGFFHAFLDGRFRAEALTEGLGTEWHTASIHFKPYPANHFTHTAIDAALRLRERGIAAAEVDRIQLGVAAPTVRTIGEPIEVKRTPDTGYQAQFSGPYVVAAALCGGGGLGLGLEDFTDALARSPERRTLMERIDVGADERCDAIYPDEFPCILTLRTHSGDEIVEQVLANRGGPQRPLSDDELATKFRANASRLLPGDAVAALEERTRDLEKLSDVRELVGLVAAP